MEKSSPVLSNLKSNIINWYNFEITNSCLLVGNIDEEVINFFNSKFDKVSTDIKSNEKFNYIFIMNYFKQSQTDKEIQDFFISMKEILDDNGKILVVLKNNLGINEIVNETFEGFSKLRIEKNIKTFEYSKFYYILPNEEYVNIIFTDEFLPSEVDIGRNLGFSKSISGKGKTEDRIFRNILKNYNNDFTLSCNSYLVELGKMPINSEISAIFFSNIRNEEYRVKTKILKDVAIKEVVSEKGIEHIKQIENNIKILNKAGIKTLDTYNENQIISKLVLSSEKLDEKFLSYYKSKNSEYKAIIEKLKNDVLLKLEKGSKENNIFEKYKLEVPLEIIDKMTFVKHGLWDLTFRNIFIIDNEYYVYDQEWYDENTPIEFILFRSIWQLESLEYDEKLNLANEFGIKDYFEFFYKLEEKLADKITNKEANRLYANSVMPDETQIEIMKADFEHQKNMFEIQKSIISNELDEQRNANNELKNKCKNLENELIR